MATIGRAWTSIVRRALHAGISLRRMWYQDRSWIGRLVAISGNSVVVDGCRFTLAHPLVTDTMRARIVRGRYERSERELLQVWLNPDAPVVECGGGIGIVATLINRRLTRPERHLVVEANPFLLPAIEQQKRLNGAAFTILNGAIDYSGRQVVSLSVDDDFISGRLGSERKRVFTVPAVTLRALIEQHPWHGATLVCDIEGTETELVEHDVDVLARGFRMLFIEAHPEFRSPRQLNTMFERLEHAGFSRVATVRKVHLWRNHER